LSPNSLHPAALFAAGRRAAIDGLELQKAGLRVNDKGYIPVDEHYRTSVPNIDAAGDVIGFPALAFTSMEQGRVAVCHAFALKYKQRVASLLPMGIYPIPEISAAGETEASCKEKKIDYVVGRGHIAGDTTGLSKLIFARRQKTFRRQHHRRIRYRTSSHRYDGARPRFDHR
jgi:NAD(P) transhydrogenase